MLKNTPDLEKIKQDLETLLKDDLEKLNQVIRAELNSPVILVNQVAEYIIQAGGKRLRPMILLLMYQCLNLNLNLNKNFNKEENQAHFLLAAIIEFIHTATLLHDDVVDESMLRRSQATANAMFGNAASVLVGDFLYSRAFQMMVGVQRLDVMRVLADATNIIAQGEVQQLMNIRDINISVADYMHVLYCKTAKLFEAACELAVLLNFEDTDNNKQEDIQKYILQAQKFGQHLGCAFQLMDDYLDYAATAEELGKNIGDDLREGKMTLPLIYLANNNLNNKNNNKIYELLEKAIIEEDASVFDELIINIQNSEALQKTQTTAIEEANKAKACLDIFPENIYKQALYQICDLAVFRKY